MNDFITMQCPNCGGNLTVGTNALSLRCEHCGVEHMIRREAGGIVLESYARCPVCNRNDRVEKVTAILRSQTHNSQGITYQTRTTMVRVGEMFIPVNQNVAVPIHTSQTSELAKHLAPPSQPQLNSNIAIQDGTSHLALVLAILLTIVGLVFLFCTVTAAVLFWGSTSSGFDTEIVINLIGGFITLIPIGIGIVLFVFGVPRERRANAEKAAIADGKRRELRRQFDEQSYRWKIAMERWNKLYYCGRDDCVFLPGTNTYAPVTSMVEYLFNA
jgi:predicted RNA-binding Zn-ribbon protein involved in translation (DUF1610 family)